MTEDRTCLSFWFPHLVAGKIPVPRTEIVRTEVNLAKLLDGETPDGFLEFTADLEAAAERIKPYPIFFRTGQTSGKHSWERTCYLKSSADIGSHVAALTEFSVLCDFMGLPVNVWVLRELLPTEPLCFLPRYDNFPLVAEARAFIEKGQVQCVHAYWPQASVEEGFPLKKRGPRKELSFDEKPEREFPEDIGSIVRSASQLNAIFELKVIDMASEVASVMAPLGGAWSVDILPTKNGLYVTDMAEAEKSFHWEGCRNAKRWKR